MGLLRALWITLRGKVVTYSRTCKECRRPLERGQEWACPGECTERWESTNAW